MSYHSELKSVGGGTASAASSSSDPMTLVTFGLFLVRGVMYLVVLLPCHQHSTLFNHAIPTVVVISSFVYSNHSVSVIHVISNEVSILYRSFFQWRI